VWSVYLSRVQSSCQFYKQIVGNPEVHDVLSDINKEDDENNFLFIIITILIFFQLS
jgi:hypothetical protein